VNLPPPLPNGSPRDRYINSLRAFVQSLIPKGGRGIRVDRKPGGTVYESDPGHGGGNVVGMVFRGEFNSGRQYAQSDAVKISAGVAAGFYVATRRPAFGEFPWTGANWTLLAKLFDQWL